MRKIRIYTLILTCLSLGVMACFPTLLQSPLREKQQQAHRRLVTVWMYGDALGASGWVRSAAAAYQKENRGVSVWVRTVTAADLALLEEDYRHTAPDVLLFTAGADVPMVYAENVRPLCLAGYALVRRTQTQMTPAPTSLFGVTPVPEKVISPINVPSSDWPGKIAADDELGAYYLHLIDAPRGAVLLPRTELRDFLQQEDSCAVLDTLEIRALIARGEGLELLQAVPGSDLMLCGAVMRGAEGAAEAFLAHLLTEKVQRELSKSGLFSARGYTLYGAGTPVLQAVEAALEGGWRPDALSWQQERKAQILTGQALYKEL